MPRSSSLNGTEALSQYQKLNGLLALQNPVYLHDRLLYTVSGVTFIAALILLSLISSLKPWTKIDRRYMTAQGCSTA